MDHSTPVWLPSPGKGTFPAGLARPVFTRAGLAVWAQQERLPGWFRGLLQTWLAKFHVTPRADLFAAADRAGRRVGGDVRTRPLYRGYAWEVVIER